MIRQGRDREAIGVLELVVCASPSDLNSKVNLASAWSRVEQPDNSQVLIAEVLKKNPQDLEACKLQARVHFQSRRFGEAQKELEYLETKEKLDLSELLPPPRLPRS